MSGVPDYPRSKSQMMFVKWQPVGESNPSYLVENQVS